MCVETLKTWACFSEMIWGVTCLGLLKKFMFSHLCPWKHYKCVLKASEQCSFFQDNWFEGSHPYSLLKKFTFSHLCPWKHYKCVLKPSEQWARFSKTIDLRGHIPRFTWKNLRFPIYVLGNTINVCWNPQNRACFSETIDLRGHMPRFTLKNECFPIYLLRNTINVCWNPQNMACFSEMIWGVTCLGLLQKWTFSHLSPEKLLKMCVETLRTVARFSKTIDLRGHMPRFTWKIYVFPSMSLETP